MTVTTITLELLRLRALKGDKIALAAYKAYRTEERLQAALKEAAAADYTEGGGP